MLHFTVPDKTPLKWHRYLCVFLYLNFYTVQCPKCSVPTLYKTRVTNLHSFRPPTASGDYNPLLINIISQTLSATSCRQLLHVSKIFSSPYFDCAIVSCHKNMAILCAALVLLWPSSTFYFNIHKKYLNKNNSHLSFTHKWPKHHFTETEKYVAAIIFICIFYLQQLVTLVTMLLLLAAVVSFIRVHVPNLHLQIK
jgi:hypothetical protein